MSNIIAFYEKKSPIIKIEDKYLKTAIITTAVLLLLIFSLHRYHNTVQSF